MRITKLLLIIIITFIMTFHITYTPSAHPGRTDSNGGHWNHSTGEYHYHTGEYAGQPQSETPSQNSFKEDNFSVPIKEFNDTQNKKTEETKKEAEPEDSQKGENPYSIIAIIAFSIIFVYCFPMLLYALSRLLIIIFRALLFLFQKIKELLK